VAHRDEHRYINRAPLRVEASSLLNSGLLALLIVGYLAFVYGLIVAAGLLITGTSPASSAMFSWTPGPWWLTTSGIAFFAATIWPVGRWLRNRVDDLVYGQHDNPYALLSQLSAHMEHVDTPTALLPTVTATLSATLKLPYVAIEANASGSQPAIVFGTPPQGAEVVRIPLVYQGTTLGTLHVSARRPGERLSINDVQLLHDLARQVGITLHAARLTEALQSSRAELVLAREEERRRIRRDLHDGLGPALASLRLQLSALRHHISDNPAAVALIDELRGDVRGATAEIRRLVYDLRPPMLDEFGLVGALHNLPLADDQFSRRIEAPEPLPVLPAALEVAIYRIAAEALHNTERHAQATTCIIRLALDGDRVTLTVSDDGCGLPANYLSGVGHQGMQERASELGGSVAIDSSPGHGTRITASFPLKGTPHA
jgi:two-component system, NarL family, sensor kinase